MSDMISYSATTLQQIGVFLRSEPMIYVFSFILLAFLVKIFTTFFPHS